MERRQLLHALNAIGACTVLPASVFIGGAAFAIEDSVTVEATEAAWEIPKIGILSVGGLGGTCLPSLGNLSQSLPYLSRTIAIETSGDELSFMEADRKVLVGDGKTVLNPHAAGLLAQSAIREIADAVAGLDMILLVAGMGGNTGTGIAPIVAQMLRQQGIFTLGFVIMPFDYESPQRQQIARAGVRDILPYVDALTPFFSNAVDPDVPFVRWFTSAVQQAPLAFDQLCRSIMNPVCRLGMVNIDFEDLRRTILSQAGDWAFGFGSASAVDGAEVAALTAIDHPVLGQDRLHLSAKSMLMCRCNGNSTPMLSFFGNATKNDAFRMTTT